MKKILMIIAVLVVILGVLIGLGYLNTSEPISNNVSDDFVTELNKYTDKEVTKEELISADAVTLNNYEKLIKQNTQESMDSNEDYCNLTYNYYIGYFLGNKSDNLECYYANDGNAEYFMQSKKELTNSYNDTQEYYKSEDKTQYMNDMISEINSIDNVYFKILMVLNSHPAIQQYYITDDSLLGTYTLSDITNFEVITPDNNPNNVNFADNVIQQGTVSYIIYIPSTMSDEEGVYEDWQMNYRITNENLLFIDNNAPINDSLIKTHASDYR